MSGKLEKIIDLVQRTGDKLVVYDQQNPEKSVVVMSLEDYERLVDSASSPLTETDFADKINRDIHNWAEKGFSPNDSQFSELSLETDDLANVPDLALSPESELVEEETSFENLLESVMVAAEGSEPAPVSQGKVAKAEAFSSLGSIIESRAQHLSANQWQQARRKFHQGIN